MDYSTRLTYLLNDLLASLSAPATWLQLAVLTVSVLTAWALHQHWVRYLAQGEKTRTRLRKLTVSTGQRLVFPFTMLLVVLTTRAILQHLHYATKLLDVAVPLLVSLATIRVTVFILRKAFAPTPLLKAWENTVALAIWVGVALHLLGWLPEILEALDSIAINIGKTRVSLLWSLKLGASVAFFLVVALWLSAILEKRVARSRHLSAGLKVGLAKSSRVVLIAAGFLLALNTIGIDLTALTIFGGALGVGLGFGLQRIASNFVSGFILLFDRSIRPGDVISIGNSFGWVQELRARYVVVRDRDGVETLIPNENLITSEVINWSYSDRRVRLKIPVQVSYGDDPEQAMALMLQAAKASPRVLTDPAPVCRLLSFGDSGINLELRVWLTDPEAGLSNVRSDVNIAIWRAFKEHSVTIPFPQRDVHMINMPLDQS